MLRNESNGATDHRRSLWFVPAVVLPVLVLLAALVPAAAMAGSGSGGSGGGSSGTCTAEVRATDEQTGARITVECGDDAQIDSVDLSLNELNEGQVDGESGTTCEPEDTSLNFTCETSGSNDGSGIAAEFTDDDGESVCADPALEIDFTVNFFGDERDSEEIENVEVTGCSGTSGGGGGDEDDGATPAGGVDSGAGGADEPSGPLAAALPLTGAALAVLALAVAGVVLRKTRTTP